MTKESESVSRVVKDSAIIDALMHALLDAGYPEYLLNQLAGEMPAFELIPLLKFLVRHWRANAPRES